MARPSCRLRKARIRLHRHPGGGREGEGRVADPAGIDRPGIQRLQQRGGGRETRSSRGGRAGRRARRPPPSARGRCRAGRRPAAPCRRRAARRRRRGRDPRGPEARGERETAEHQRGHHAASARAPRSGEQPAEGRDQVAAIRDGVLQRVEAADQEGAHAEVVIVEQRLGDLLGRADQGGGVARTPRSPRAMAV